MNWLDRATLALVWATAVLAVDGDQLAWRIVGTLAAAGIVAGILSTAFVLRRRP